MIERALLIANSRAGLGQAGAAASALSRRLKERLPAVEVSAQVVEGHAQARRVTAAYLRASPQPAAVLVCGGGGTLRAVLEGVWEGEARSHARVCLGPLRLGSGNVLARQLGVPREPEEAIADFAAALAEGRRVKGWVMACAAGGGPEGVAPERRQAVALGGFGLLGRVPGALARFQSRRPRWRNFLARGVGLERFTRIEYACALFLQSWAGAFQSAGFEQVEIRQGGRVERMRLLAGALLNFPLAALPFPTQLRLEEPELELYAVPYRGRLQALSLVFFPRLAVRGAALFRINRDQPVELRLLDRPRAEYFLDEDPEEWRGTLTLSVAGAAAFLPGRDYAGPGARG